MSEKEQIEEMGNIIAEVAFVRAHEENGDDNLADIVAEELAKKYGIEEIE